jgi:hypothetical protein
MRRTITITMTMMMMAPIVPPTAAPAALEAEADVTKRKESNT